MALPVAEDTGLDGTERVAGSGSASPPRAAPRRRPGKPLGYPKPPGSGRKPGTPNRITKEIRAVAQKHGAKAVRELVKLMTKSDDATIRLRAAQELLDRGYGRPVAPSEISGPGGAPVGVGLLGFIAGLPE